MDRPVWCPHKDCKCLGFRQNTCIGRLPEPADHPPYKAVNTHRWCLEGAADNGGVFDLQVNWGDLWQFVLFFNKVAEDVGRKPFAQNMNG